MSTFNDLSVWRKICIAYRRFTQLQHECPQRPDFEITALIVASGLLLLITSLSGLIGLFVISWCVFPGCDRWGVALWHWAQLFRWNALMSLFSTHRLYTPEWECTIKDRYWPTSPQRHAHTHVSHAHAWLTIGENLTFLAINMTLEQKKYWWMLLSSENW